MYMTWYKYIVKKISSAQIQKKSVFDCTNIKSSKSDCNWKIEKKYSITRSILFLKMVGKYFFLQVFRQIITKMHDYYNWKNKCMHSSIYIFSTIWPKETCNKITLFFNDSVNQAFSSTSVKNFGTFCNVHNLSVIIFQPAPARTNQGSGFV